MRRGNLVAAAVALLVPSCTSRGRQEAAQVAEAMDRFRKADNASKPATVGSLRAVKCSVTDVCHARDACLASAEATSKSLVLKSEVEQTLSAVEKGTMLTDAPAARALGGKLDEAETLLKEGFAALPACDDQIMALKRKYGF
jgi:hypothetical protein